MTAKATTSSQVRKIWTNSDGEKRMGYTVYMHVNKTNGKKYIGITCQSKPQRRWSNGEGYKQQRRFYNAIKSYGFDGFDHIILEHDLTKEEAEEKEQYYIRKYKSNNLEYGYNIENGGHVNKYTDEQRKHMSIVHTGRVASEESKKKMSIVMRGKSTEWLIGRKTSEETKAKMSAKHTGVQNARARKVYQYDLQGNFVAEYEYMDLIKDVLGIKSTSRISRCCLGQRKKAHNFMWSYEKKEMSPYVRQWRGGIVHA